jgi:hypothetical protein
MLELIWDRCCPSRHGLERVVADGDAYELEVAVSTPERADSRLEASAAGGDSG